MTFQNTVLQDEAQFLHLPPQSDVFSAGLMKTSQKN